MRPVLAAVVLAVVLGSCVSTEAAYPQANCPTVDAINARHLSYRNVTLSMIMESSRMNQYIDSIGRPNLMDTSTVFEVTLAQGEWSILVNLELVEFAETDPTIREAINVGAEQITMLFKYLRGFFYGALIPQGATLVRVGPDLCAYEAITEDQDPNWRNQFLVTDGLVYEALVFEEGTTRYAVRIEYAYQEFEGIHYLSGITAHNRYRGFNFNIDIEYEQERGYLVPVRFRSHGNKGVFYWQFVNTAHSHRLLSSQ